MEVLKYILVLGVLAIAGAYAIFLALVYVGFLFRKRRTTEELRKQNLSVVVAARNEGKNIPALLDALSRQTYAEKFDVIIVDDHSTDNTADAICAFSSDKFSLTYLTARGEGKKAALTEGIEFTSSEIILITDADCMPGPGWVESFGRLFNEQQVEFVAGMVKYQEDSGKLRAVLQTEMIFLQVASAGLYELGVASMCNGASMGFRKHFFEDVRGFSDNNYVSGDDILLLHKAMKRNKNVVRWNYDKTAWVTTRSAETIKDAIKQRLRWLSKFNGFKTVGFMVTGWLFLGVQLLLPAAVLFSLSIKSIDHALTYAAGLKILVELLFLSLTAPYFKEQKTIPVFPLSVILYELISLGAVLGTFTDEVHWKDRKWKRGKMA